MAEPVLVVARSGLLSNIQIPLTERTYTTSSVQCQTLPLPLILATEGFLSNRIIIKKSTQIHPQALCKEKKEGHKMALVKRSGNY